MTINIGVTNWMTTLAGVLAGIPPIILASAMAAGVVLSSHWTFALSIVSGLGTLLIGLAAKDANTHSTPTQIAKAAENVAMGKLPKA